MKELNLIGVEIKDVEAFLFEASINNINISCETGEYGMILFHKLMSKYTQSLHVEVKENYLVNTSSFTNQYFKYTISNGRTLLIEHKPELDIKEGQKIDEISGFPIKSSTLYLKE